MRIPYAGAEGMLPQTTGTLTIRNEKLLRLSYNLVNRLHLLLISKYRSKYEADFTEYVASLNFKFFRVDAMYQILETRIV